MPPNREVVEKAKAEVAGGDSAALDFNTDINQEFLEKILEKKIKSFTIKTGSNPGDNFTSILFAVKVFVEGDENKDPLHLLIKTYPALEARQKFLNETNLFLKEVNVYREYIPDLVRFQEGMGRCGSDIVRLAVPPFVAGKGVDYSKENTDSDFSPVSQLDNYLVMIDIRKTYGYQMCEKRLGLDFDHTTLAVKELAKTHALGWAYKQTEKLPSLLTRFPYFIEMCFNKCDSSVSDMLTANFDLVEGIVKTKCGGNARIMKGFERVRKIGPMEIMCTFITNDGVIDENKACKFMDLNLHATDSNAFFSDPWVVSCHGDSWMNNMLFKYGENSHSASVHLPKKPAKPTEMMFVDLQMYREGCPTTDLSYMLYTSTTYSLRKAHLESLLHIYYQEFLGICERLGVAPLQDFTFENLLWRFKRAKIFGFITACLVLPIILTSAEEALADMDNVKERKLAPETGETGADAAVDTKEDGFAELLRALTESAGKNEVLVDRFMGIVNELIEDNIF